MEEIFITRQAIFNAHHEVVGYELLYHDGSACHGSPCSDAEQSAQLIVNTFMGFGLENLVGSNKAFINLSHDFFIEDHPIPMASYQLVLEVSGRCIEDDKVYQELKQLAKQGYTLSLYDYEYKESTAERLDCIDLVKLDISRYDGKALKEQTRYFRNHGKRIQVKGLTTASEELLCSQLGVDYYQGDLFSPVEPIKGKGWVCRRSVLHEIIETHPDQLSDAQLASTLSKDAVLCYKILRYINCASFSERKEISSLEQALEQIGLANLKQWAHLTLATQAAEGSNIDLATHSIIRARMCRDLAQKSGTSPPASAFLVGLLSTLDKALETPLEDLLDSLALSPDIAFALLYDEGPLGHLLQQVKHIENGEWGQLDTSCLGRDDYTHSYEAAQQYAVTLTG